MAKANLGRLAGSAGYTVVEALTVVAAMGAVAALTAPSMLRFQAIHDVQSASAQVGGMLQKARARAIAEATPQLVLFQEEEVDGGKRTAFALLVSDNDRSYTVTPPDDVEAFSLDASVPAQVRQFGVAPDSKYENISAAPGDGATTRSSNSGSGSTSSGTSGSGSSGSGSSGSGSSGSGSGGLIGTTTQLISSLLGGSGSSGSGSSGSSGSGSSGSGTSGSGTSTTSADTTVSVAHGTTFPVSETDGVPVIAFNERGIPVSPDSPQNWGSGAGAVYLTDNEHAVFAVVVTALGAVEMSRYDSATSTWK